MLKIKMQFNQHQRHFEEWTIMERLFGTQVVPVLAGEVVPYSTGELVEPKAVSTSDPLAGLSPPSSQSHAEEPSNSLEDHLDPKQKNLNV